MEPYPKLELSLDNSKKCTSIKKTWRSSTEQGYVEKIEDDKSIPQVYADEWKTIKDRDTGGADVKIEWKVKIIGTEGKDELKLTWRLSYKR